MSNDKHPFEHDPEIPPAKGVLNFPPGFGKDWFRNPIKILMPLWRDESGSMTGPLPNVSEWMDFKERIFAFPQTSLTDYLLPYDGDQLFARKVEPVDNTEGNSGVRFPERDPVRQLKPNEYTVTEDPDTGQLTYHEGLPEPRVDMETYQSWYEVGGTGKETDGDE